MSDISVSLGGVSNGGASGATVRDYLLLMKPRVMSLVVFTALVGLIVAPGHVNPAIASIAILAIAAGAGASGALNMWYDADIDVLMTRTDKRPVATGRIEPGDALGFGLAVALFSVMVLGLATNVFAGAFLAFTIFFYAVVYTMWLKRWTAQNIVIGGAAGAFPPMIGWAAATGGASWEAFALFLIIFLWTPPHFWALALAKTEDYARAGVPMLPNVAGASETRRQILIYSVLFALSGLLPLWLGGAHWFYGVCAVGAGSTFVWYAWRVYRVTDGQPALKAAWKLFGYSILHLFGLFSALLTDSLAGRLGLL